MIILQVKLLVIWEYIKSCTFLITLLFNVGYNGCAVGSNIWLTKWSSDEGKKKWTKKHDSFHICKPHITADQSQFFCSSQYLAVYTALGVDQSILVLFASYSLALGGTFAS